MVATGNHEPELFSAHVAADKATVDNYEPLGYGGLKKRLDMPTTGPSSCPSVYSFSYGNVGVISVDANELSWEIQGLLGYSHGAQVRWIEDTLAAWRKNPGIDFIVAFFHECAFSTCEGHGSDGGVRAKLAPLFSRYQVDLAVTASPSTRRPATSRRARAAARPWSRTRKRRPGRTSTRRTSATPSRPSTGRRPATPTTVSSPST